MLDDVLFKRRGRPPKTFENIKGLMSGDFIAFNPITPPTSSFGSYIGLTGISGIGGNVLTGRGNIEDMILLNRTRIPKYSSVTEFGELGRITTLIPSIRYPLVDFNIDPYAEIRGLGIYPTYQRYSQLYPKKRLLNPFDEIVGSIVEPMPRITEAHLEVARGKFVSKKSPKWQMPAQIISLEGAGFELSELVEEIRYERAKKRLAEEKLKQIEQEYFKEHKQPLFKGSPDEVEQTRKRALKTLIREIDREVQEKKSPKLKKLDKLKKVSTTERLAVMEAIEKKPKPLKERITETKTKITQIKEKLSKLGKKKDDKDELSHITHGVDENEPKRKYDFSDEEKEKLK